jgi:hypothetical protein
MLKVRSSDVQRVAAGAPRSARRIELAQVLFLAATIDRDPYNEH